MKKLLFLLLLSTLSFAKSEVVITEARVFVPVKGMNNTAAYASLKNETPHAISVTIKSLSPFKRVETHETIEKDGMVTMNKVEKFIVPANGTFIMKTGGSHIMLFDASREIKAGEELNAELIANGKVISAKFLVEERMKKPAAPAEHHH